MQTSNGLYVNSCNIELMFKKDDKYYTYLNGEIHELANVPQDTFGYLVFIPGSRLIETIESADSDKSLVIDKETRYFEKEIAVVYFINHNKINVIEKLKENTVSISTEQDNYLFEILPENISRFESRLVF